MHRLSLIGFAFLFMLSQTGCGSSSTSTPGGGAPATRAFARTNNKPSYPKEKGTASIKGQITLKGSAPVMEKVDLKSDPVCAGMHPKGLFPQSMLAGEKNELQNVLVYVSKGMDEYSFDVPEKPFELNQKECQFVPRVFGMLNGQVLKATNDDPTFHNVRSVSKLNPFNMKAAKGEFETCAMEKPEGPVTLICDVHHWMRAYVAVFTHPFFDVTGPFGKFELKGLVPGEYTITIWHESLGTQSQTITVGDKDEKTLDFTLEVSAK